MIDYIISIACNTFPEIEKQLKEVPYNNEGASELAKHLQEKFDREKYENYIKDTVIQKLSYKLSRADTDESIYTIYDYLIDFNKE